MSPLRFAYYCSGHGYGHATRVSAFAACLRQLGGSPTVHIISSAPKHVFDVAISYGALYRFAEIDPVIVQPLAYYVDRRKSVDDLTKFLSKKDQKIRDEAAWLRQNAVDCVLSDAAFLACEAANAAHVPSVLITNFTFDSVYGYLSIRFPDGCTLNPDLHRYLTASRKALTLNDDPIPAEELAPLVRQLYEGYRCAELLLQLPGNIPIPSFTISPPLPSYLWTDPIHNSFTDDVHSALSQEISSERLHPSVPFQSTRSTHIPKPLPRKVIQAPLIVRHPSPDIYTPSGRKRVLGSIGIPKQFQTSRTKLLVVSFGGQVFRRPRSHNSSRSHSPNGSHTGHSSVSHTPSTDSLSPGCPESGNNIHMRRHGKQSYIHVVPPVVTESHIWVPGAPPAHKSPIIISSPSLPDPYNGTEDGEEAINIPAPHPESNCPKNELSPEYRFLPDDTWIAIVCGATTSTKETDGDDQLPHNFFVAPRDVYMPDLTALGDVLLGKLGYGTTAECVDASTPFVYVPRPLFVEEHGLRRLLQDEGVGIELSREKYEAGDWADAIQEAWLAGRGRKEQKRLYGDDGSRREQGLKMAQQLYEWVEDWKRAERPSQERR